MSAKRVFAALLSPDGIWLVEYQEEPTGCRILGEWSDRSVSAQIGEAVDRLLALLGRRNIGRPELSIVVDQFGAFHHMMMLPAASEDVLRPIVLRETQRTFGVADAIVAYAMGDQVERREPSRADVRTAPRQVLIAGAPRDMIEALAARLRAHSVNVRGVTVVASALRALFAAAHGSLEPTAVLVCLSAGPHLGYFLDGRLELSMDPPIVLQGERATTALIVDQVERGNVYLRQQFRGAAANVVLLAAPADEYDELAKTLADQFGVRVKPLFNGDVSPEAVVAMGAALQGQATALDVFPHPPTLMQRASAFARSSMGVVAAASLVAIMTGVWSLTQFVHLAESRNATARLEEQVRTSMTQMQSLRDVAERRADFARTVSFIRTSQDERASLAAALAATANAFPTMARLDSLRASRTTAGWGTSLAGIVEGATTGEAVRTLNALFQSLRGLPQVASATLDEFSYAGSASLTGSKSDTSKTPRDSSGAAGEGAVAIRYRISLTLRSGRAR